MPLETLSPDLTLRVRDRQGGVEIMGAQSPGPAQLDQAILSEGDALELVLGSGERVTGRVAALPDPVTELYPGLCFRLVGAQLAPKPAPARTPQSEPAPKPLRGVHGNLLDLPLPDVVQAMEMCRKTVEVCVQPEDGVAGSVFLRDGEVVCAQAGEHRGEEAFYLLAAATCGRFSIAFGKEAPTRNVTAKVTHLLLEAARRQDEQARDPFDERTTEEPLCGDSSCVFDLVAEDSELPGDLCAPSAERASDEGTSQQRPIFSAFFDATDSATEVDEPTVRVPMLH